VIAFGAEYGVIRYQFAKSASPAKQGVKSLAVPVIDGAFSPDKCHANDVRMVEARILAFRDVDDLTLDVSYSVFSSEFAGLLFRGRQVRKLPPEEVVHRQRTARQRNTMRDAYNTMCPRRKNNRTMMKTEAYQKMADPRPITMFDHLDRMKMAEWVYPISDIIDQEPWFAFTLTPEHVSRRVATVCKGATMVVNTDFSRFDGHVGYATQLIELALLCAAIPECNRGDFSTEYLSGLNRRSKSTQGVSYHPGFSRGSGRLDTCIGNTLLNAFAAFATFRKCGYKPHEAYARLGIYGGDDGVTSDVDCNAYARVARDLGFNLELEPITMKSALNGHNVKFLSRIYSPAVFQGNTDNVADIVRAWSKWHTVASLSNETEAVPRLLEKTFCLLQSDRNTPFYGEFLAAICGVYNKDTFDPRWTEFDWSRARNGNYTCDCVEWAGSFVQSQLAALGFNFGKFRDELRELRAAAGSCQSHLVLRTGKCHLGSILPGRDVTRTLTSAPTSERSATSKPARRISQERYNALLKAVKDGHGLPNDATAHEKHVFRAIVSKMDRARGAGASGGTGTGL
jgi:hypothetical protein